MKKLLLLSVAVLAVFSLAFTACDSAVGPTTVTQGYSKLDSPKIQTKVYPGAVVVTWKPVKDAEGYIASRIDNTTLQATDLTSRVTTAAASGGGAVTLVDVVNYGNELVNGRSYTYVVTAYNALSIGYGGTPLTTPPTNPIDGNSGDILPVLNSQSEATVKANVPATITFPTLAETNITLETFSNLAASEEFLKVSYPKIPDSQYNPGIGLQLTYSYGSENTDKLSGNTTYVLDVKDSGAGYAVFPLIGGINTVNARYVWDKDNSTYANTFYTGPAAVTKVTENLAKTVLPTVALTAGLGTDGRAAPYVTLQYTYNATSPSREMTGDITPVVYRAAVIGKTNVTSSLNTGTTVGGWTALTTTWKNQTSQDDGEEIDPLTYTRYAEDTTVEKGNTYAYLLILTTPTQTTVPSASGGIAIPAVLPKAPTLAVLNVAVTQNRESSGILVSPPTYGIAVSWQGDETSTYKLFRAPNVGTNDTTGAKPGDWTELTVPAKDGLNKYSYYDNTGLSARTSYYYKVIGTNDGIENTKTRLATGNIYVTGTAALTGSLTVTTSGTTPGGTTLSAGEVGLTISQQAANTTLLAAGETVRIYYWPTSSTAQFAAAEVAEWTKAQAENSGAGPRETIITPAARNRQYTWEAYIKLADGTLAKSTSGLVTGFFTAP